MKTTVLVATLLVSSLALARPKPGDAAPDFAAPSTSGKTVRLADYKGQTLVLAFFPKAFTGG
jgi:peroxiredoxin Q/BCP